MEAAAGRAGLPHQLELGCRHEAHGYRVLSCGLFPGCPEKVADTGYRPTQEAADLFVCANPTGMTAAAREKQLHLAKIGVRDRSGLCFTPNAFA